MRKGHLRGHPARSSRNGAVTVVMAGVYVRQADLETLQSMFPDHDTEQLSSALIATGNSVEAAIQQLLDGERTINADEV